MHRFGTKIGKVVLASTVAATIAAAAPAHAKSHPYSAALVTHAQSLFFENGTVSRSKVDAYIARLKQKRDELRSLHVGVEKMDGERDPKKIAKKVDDEKSLLALDVAISNLETLKNSKDEAVIYEMAANALDIEGSLRIFGRPWALADTIKQTIYGFKTWSIQKKATAADEASNLYDPAKKAYLSVAEIQKLKDQGVDLSVYGPGPTSPFWENPGDVRKVNLGKAGLGQTLKLYEGGIADIPSDLVFHYDEMKHSDTKPKMDVVTKDKKGKKKDKFKLKWGAEIHADPTTAALTMALGFKADVTKYVKNVKVYIGKTPLGEIKREWDVYYSRDAVRGVYPFEKYVQKIDKDKDGEYIIFKEALIEAKPKEIERLGGWGFSEFGHTDLREVRGLSMVQLWLRNSDMKEFDNNRLLLKKEADGSMSRHLIISDLGASLGSMFHEMPDLLTWKMIERQNAGEIVLKYNSFHPSGIRNIMTESDARWGVRLISNLSRDQIKAAVDYGSWPECMRPILVEKLISRRNDLIQGLGLAIPLTPVNGPKKDYEIDARCDMKEVKEQFTSEFEMDLPRILGLVAEQLRKTSFALARSGINSTRRIQLTGPQLGMSKHLIGDVIVDIDRVLEKNPAPKTEEDIFVVKDRFEMGFRLGAKFGAYKDFTYTKSFTLAYPGRSIKESELNNDFLVNLLLPFNLRHGKVPDKYVLMTEHYLERGAGVELEASPTALISPILKSGVARVRLSRSIFDHRDPAKYTMYRDRTSFTQASLEGLVRLFIVKIPVFKTLSQWGQATGRGSTFTADELSRREGSDTIVKAMVDGDFSEVEPREKVFDLVNDFSARESAWKFLFWGCERSREVDQITLTSEDGARSGLQFRTMKDCARNILGNKEQKSVSVEAYTDAAKPGTYQLNVRVMSYDADTQEKHLENRYLGFVNGLSLDGSRVIDITPSLGYTVNKRWGALVTTSDTQYSETAMSKILTVSPAAFWSALAGSMRITPSKLETMRKDARTYQRERTSTRSVAKPTPEAYGLTADDVETFREAEKLLKRIEGAKKEKELKKRVEKIAEAVRESLFVGSSGFYSPRILGALNRIAGSGNVYSKNLITVPPFKEVNLPEEVGMFGEVGEPLSVDNRYLVFKPVSGVDLYSIFDSWF